MGFCPCAHAATREEGVRSTKSSTHCSPAHRTTRSTSPHSRRRSLSRPPTRRRPSVGRRPWEHRLKLGHPQIKKGYIQWREALNRRHPSKTMPPPSHIRSSSPLCRTCCSVTHPRPRRRRRRPRVMAHAVACLPRGCFAAESENADDEELAPPSRGKRPADEPPSPRRRFVGCRRRFVHTCGTRRCATCSGRLRGEPAGNAPR